MTVREIVSDMGQLADELQKWQTCRVALVFKTSGGGDEEVEEVIDIVGSPENQAVILVPRKLGQDMHSSITLDGLLEYLENLSGCEQDYELCVQTGPSQSDISRIVFFSFSKDGKCVVLFDENKMLDELREQGMDPDHEL